MKTDTQHLRSLLEYFEIRNKSVAAALNIHPSLVTKWLNNERLIGVNSKYLEPLADFILTRNLTAADTEWLKKQFRVYGIKGDFASVSDLRRGLMLWLITDPNDDIEGLLLQESAASPSLTPAFGNHPAITGITDIMLRLASLWAKLPLGATVDIRVAGESVIANPSFLYAVNNAVDSFGLRFHLLLALPYKDRQPSRTVLAYLDRILDGSMEVAVVFEDNSAVIEETAVINPNHCVVLISSLIDSAAPAAALVIREETFVRDLEKRFNESYGRAQTFFAPAAESTRRQLQTIANESYVSTNTLFFLRDGLQPLFLSPNGFKRFLQSLGYQDDDLQWRMEEFEKRKAVMEEGLANGLHLKELLPLAPLCEVMETGSATVPGEDFFETAGVKLHDEVCLDLLEGYIHYLNAYPNLSIRFFRALPQSIADSWCLIKDDECFVMEKRKNIEQKYLISRHIVLLQGVAKTYNDVWEKLDYAAHGKEATLSYLERCAVELKNRQG